MTPAPPLQPASEPNGVVQRLRRWWRAGDSAEQYLADATDRADLERRMRSLERTSGGPAIVRFDR
jgi:Protein of unknown function (DUF3563)